MSGLGVSDLPQYDYFREVRDFYMLKNREHINRHDYLSQKSNLLSYEKRTLYVIYLTLVTMIIEISAGYITGSMALLADGWHMFSHAGALFITYLTYRLAQSPKLKPNFSFGTGKFLPLGGYTSAIILGVVAILMFVESIDRFFNPEPIRFIEAMGVAIVGLIVNLASAFILKGHDHHQHGHEMGHGHHHDHNIESAYFHVLADALTSILAILGLMIAFQFQINWIDPAIGIVGSIIILRWSWGLIKKSAWDLLDGHPSSISIERVLEILHQYHVKVEDCHFWNIAPGTISGSLVIKSSVRRGAEFYRDLIQKEYQIDHLVIEEQVETSDGFKTRSST
jgi:cation diffusion facilitator family transporter